MKVIMGRRWSLGSIAIRLFTWSKWSHCAVVMNDSNTVIEATAEDGVTQSTLESFKKKYPDYLVLEYPAYKGWEERARSQLFKPYDWSGVVGIVLRRNWESESMWFCSELVAFVSGYFNNKYIGRIVPQHIAMFGKEVK